MQATDVNKLYSDLQELGITIWIDGGWGVDALLGEQTRAHKDLDMAIQQQGVPRLCALLRARGYREIKLQEARPWNFVLADASGREIDVHVMMLDANANGIYGPVENGQMYPSASLAGQGVIQGQAVKCISAQWAVKFHSGYPLQQKDFEDVSALCRKFGLDLPQEYLPFARPTIGIR
jgi:lincosamide nucleotidyltransferase A/C/D/E